MKTEGLGTVRGAGMIPEQIEGYQLAGLPVGPFRRITPNFLTASSPHGGVKVFVAQLTACSPPKFDATVRVGQELLSREAPTAKEALERLLAELPMFLGRLQEISAMGAPHAPIPVAEAELHAKIARLEEEVAMLRLVEKQWVEEGEIASKYVLPYCLPGENVFKQGVPRMVMKIRELEEEKAECLRFGEPALLCRARCDTCDKQAVIISGSTKPKEQLQDALTSRGWKNINKCVPCALDAEIRAKEMSK